MLDYISSFSIAGIVHIVGLLLLSKSKCNFLNQRILTINLALAEMLFCWVRVIYSSVVYTRNDGFIIKISVMAISVLLFTEIRFAMLHIIFDRFFEIYTNIKYPVYMTRKMLLILVVSQWVVSVLSGVIALALQILVSKHDSLVFSFTLFLCLDILVFLFGIATYAYFYFTAKKLRSLEIRIPNQTNDGGRLLLKKFQLPCYIVLTYILFNITSTGMLTMSRNVHFETAKTLFHFSYAPIVAGFISDALIYTIGDRNVRKLLRTMLRRETLQVSNRISDLVIVKTSYSLS